MFGDGLGAYFSGRPSMCVVAVVDDLARLRDTLVTAEAHVVLVDVARGINVCSTCAPSRRSGPQDVAIVALGLNDHKQEVIRCGRAGFTGYVARDTPIDALCTALSGIVAGRLACPPEIVGGLLALCFAASRGRRRTPNWASI